MTEVVIASGARTPVGSFNGSLSAVPAHYLGETAIKAALERAGVEGKDVSEVIMGQILTAAQGQNPARRSGLAPAQGQQIGLCVVMDEKGDQYIYLGII